MKQSTMHIQLNNRDMQWDEDPNWRAEPCRGCSKPTRGRAAFFSEKRDFVNLPYCIGCAVDLAFERVSQ